MELILDELCSISTLIRREGGRVRRKCELTWTRRSRVVKRASMIAAPWCLKKTAQGFVRVLGGAGAWTVSGLDLVVRWPGCVCGVGDRGAVRCLLRALGESVLVARSFRRVARRGESEPVSPALIHAVW